MVESKNGVLLDDMVNNAHNLFDKYKDKQTGVILDEGLTKLLFDLDLTVNSREAAIEDTVHEDQNEHKRFV